MLLVQDRLPFFEGEDAHVLKNVLGELPAAHDRANERQDLGPLGEEDAE